MVKYDTPKVEYGLYIDSGYYNTLDIRGFSLMMKDPAYCYKFYWLEAIVQLMSMGKKEAKYDEIIDEMIANAWYSVVGYHVHLSGLPNTASKTEIKNKIAEFNKELHNEKLTLTRNVPYKALSGFANQGAERIDLNCSAGRMMAYYNQISKNENPLPYTFGKQTGLERKIYFHEE